MAPLQCEGIYNLEFNAALLLFFFTLMWISDDDFPFSPSDVLLPFSRASFKWSENDFLLLTQIYYNAQSRLLTSHSHRGALAPSPDWHCHYTFILNASAAPANSPFARTSSHALIISMKISLIFRAASCVYAKRAEHSSGAMKSLKNVRCSVWGRARGKIILHHTRHYTLNSIASAAPKMLSQMSQMLAYNITIRHHTENYRIIFY